MGELSRTVATLRISGDDLDPGEVTRLLGAEPSTFARKGEARPVVPSGRALVARTGMWRLHSPEAVPGDLNGQVRALLAAVTGDLSVWRGLSARHRCDVFCGLFMANGNEGEDLAPDVLIGAGRAGPDAGAGHLRIRDRGLSLAPPAFRRHVTGLVERRRAALALSPLDGPPF